MSLGAVRQAASPAGRRLVGSYLLAATSVNLLWETAQLPAYILWRTAKPLELAGAVLHCTAGDVMIAAGALFVALLAAGTGAWPSQGYRRVAAASTILVVCYTIFSEWLNVGILRRWTYAPAMILVPPLGTGLSPLLQSILLPMTAFFVARRLAAGPAAVCATSGEEHEPSVWLPQAKGRLHRSRR